MDILRALSEDPNLAPALRRALRPLAPVTEPEDYSDEEPIRDDRYADRAAADWAAWRLS